MFKAKKDFIKYCYLDVVNGNEKLKFNEDDLEDFFQRLSWHCFDVDFGYDCLKHELIDDIINYAVMSALNFNVRISDYNDFSKLPKDFFLPRLTVVMDPQFDMKYKSNTIDDDQRFMWHECCDLRHSNNIGVIVFDLYVDNSNINGLYETANLIANHGFMINIVFKTSNFGYGYKPSKYLTCKSKDEIPFNDIACRLILDRVFNIDDKHFWTPKSIIDKMFYLRQGYKCGIGRQCYTLFVDTNFQMCLCDKISGSKCKLSPLECIDRSGELTDKFLDAVKADYSFYCSGCKCCNILKFLDNEKERR